MSNKDNPAQQPTVVSDNDSEPGDNALHFAIDREDGENTETDEVVAQDNDGCERRSPRTPKKRLTTDERLDAIKSTVTGDDEEIYSDDEKNEVVAKFFAAVSGIAERGEEEEVPNVGKGNNNNNEEKPTQPPPLTRKTTLREVSFYMLCTVLVIAAVFTQVYGNKTEVVHNTSTFPDTLHVYQDNEVVFAVHIPSRHIREEELEAQVIDHKVKIKDMQQSMKSYVDLYKNSIVVPLYYGIQYKYSAIAFHQDDVSRFIINPTIWKHSGSIIVSQKPHLCSKKRLYQLPSVLHVKGVVNAASFYETVTLKGAQAAAVFTVIEQLQGKNVCDDKWNSVKIDNYGAH